MTQSKNNYLVSLILIGALYFIFGFVTWLNGALIPFLKTACELSDFLAYFVTFAFYISYFVMAIPSSKILEKVGFKNGISFGLMIMALGAFLFIPSAALRYYPLFLIALFLLGVGLALMQTAVNPYVTIIGPIESAAKRISIMGIWNKFAGILAPLLLATFILGDAEAISEQIAITSIAEKESLLQMLSNRLIVPYACMGGVLVFLALMVRFSPLPEPDEEESESRKEKSSIFKYKYLIFGVVALFFYVGVEVIAGDTIIRYGQSLGVSMESAKYFTGLTLLGMVIGYLIGVALIPKVISQRMALIACSVLGLVFGCMAIFTPTAYSFTFPFIDLLTFKSIQMTIPYSVFFIALLGLANSLVWPAIWPLALDGVKGYTKLGSAFLIMAIAGGAVMPLIYGKLADLTTTQSAYWIVLPCYLIILSFALFGYKMGKSSHR